MPRLGGEELVRALWAERPGLPVLVVTGSVPPGGAEALGRDAEDRGPLAMLHKPVEYDALAGALRRLAEPAFA